MSKLINLEGQRFGKLTVINRAGVANEGSATWNCICDCGKKTIGKGCSLTNGEKKSCSSGCYREINLRGKIFGKLTVITRGNKKGSGAYWLCKCECGNEIEVRTDNLRKGDVTSCGCLTTLPHGESAKKWLYNHIKYDAKKRNIVFELTYEQFGKITKEKCFYCNIEPYVKTDRVKHNRSNGDYIYNGIDRKNNSKGYIVENSLPCCKTCNAMKSDLDLGTFINQVKKIYKKFA